MASEVKVDVERLKALAGKAPQDPLHLLAGEDLEMIAISVGPARHLSKTLARFDGPYASAVEADKSSFAYFWQAATPQTIISLCDRVKALEEALKPFVALLQAHHADIPDHFGFYGVNDAEVTYGDLRKARALLSEREG